MSTENDAFTSLSRIKENIIERFPNEGAMTTHLEDLHIFKSGKTHPLIPQVYDPCIVFGINGRKYLTLDEKSYDYGAGNFFTLLVPMPVACEIIDASPENPFIAIVIKLETERLSNVLMRMNRHFEAPEADPEKQRAELLFSRGISPKMIALLERLIDSQEDPCEADIVGNGIIDEIYFRILKDEQGGALRYHLQERGQIKQISRAVDFVHQHIEESVSVDTLADLVYMSTSGFHKKFKELMHISPLQYIKSIKLNKAKTHILQGNNAGEAALKVGYNSIAQFSREYKRYFGYLPSKTVEAGT